MVAIVGVHIDGRAPLDPVDHGQPRAVDRDGLEDPLQFGPRARALDHQIAAKPVNRQRRVDDPLKVADRGGVDQRNQRRPLVAESNVAAVD